MTKSALALDCLPLDSPSEARLSHVQLGAAESLQRTLVSPHDHPDVDAWRSAVNAEAMAATGADAAMFQLMLPGIAPHFSEDLCTTRLDGYAEFMPGFERQRGIFQRAVHLGAGNRYSLWIDHLDWLYASVYYNEWISEIRAFDTLFAAVPSRRSDFPAMLHVYHEHPTRGPRFDASAVRLMQLVRPALEAGVRAVEQSLANRASLVATLDTRQDGALVFDRSGRLLHENAGFTIVVPIERDRETIVDAGREMAKGLLSGEERLLFDPATARRAVSSGSELVLLTAVLVGEGVFDLGPVAMVSVHGNEPPVSEPAALRDRFDLTPRQAEVARLLARRLTNDEIAQRLQVSPNTARHHTEAVMGKLDVRDRREVGSLIRRPSQHPGR